MKMETEKSLYKKYRPRRLSDLLGQDGAVSSLKMLIEQERVPQVILLSGPSGCGKTTIGRILKDKLDCGDPDYVEINCADFRGIDTVRDIRRAVNLRPMAGSCRMWLIDECHKLTNDAQNGLLKILEDTPPKVYFLLATTDPQKLIKTIITRSTQISVVSLSPAVTGSLVRSVAEKEKYELTEDVVDAIVEAADGSARKALVILEQVGGLETEDDQLGAVKGAAIDKVVVKKLAQVLLFGGKNWGEAAACLKTLEGEDPEQIRYMVLGYARKVLLGGGAKGARAFVVLDVFSGNFYDSKQAGLAAACWEIMNQ